MAAATEQVRIIMQSFNARANLTKALRGTAWKRGWMLAAHNDRLMAYPDGGFNTDKTAAAGGPLQVPGADANGGLRFIAKRDKVELLVNAASGSGSVSVSQTGSIWKVTVTPAAAVSADSVVAAIRNAPAAMALIDVAYTGSGGSAPGTLAQTAVPYVRLYGWAQNAVDVTDSPSTDVTLNDPSVLGAVEYGVGRMRTADTILSPGPLAVLDNQTVTNLPTPLALPINCTHLFDGDAYCEVV